MSSRCAPLAEEKGGAQSGAMQVRRLMSSPARTVSEHDSLREALQTMRNDRLHHLPVVRDGRVVGVLSERDFLVRLHPDSPRALTGCVREAMTPAVHAVRPGASLEEAAATLLANEIGCVPVIEGGTLVGILTTRDVLRHVARRRRARA
jgi:CBS domain-containing protein